MWSAWTGFEQARQVLELWHSITVCEVYRSPLVTFPRAAAEFVGQSLGLPGVKLTHLLDTAPLRRKARGAIDT